MFFSAEQSGLAGDVSGLTGDTGGGLILDPKDSGGYKGDVSGYSSGEIGI